MTDGCTQKAACLGVCMCFVFFFTFVFYFSRWVCAVGVKGVKSLFALHHLPIVHLI